MGRDVTLGQAQGSQAIHRWTVILVVVLLLFLYRSPLLILIPLITVFVAVEVALKFLSLLAQANLLTVFASEETFITVIVYGTGVDYCLFLMSRYREELEKGTPFAEAVAHAIGKVGATLTASSATVTLGIGMMIFADFGQFHLGLEAESPDTSDMGNSDPIERQCAADKVRQPMTSLRLTSPKFNSENGLRQLNVSWNTDCVP